MDDALKMEKEKRKKERAPFNRCDIAVVGIACKLPGAENYQEYWDNLVKGVNSISEIPADRWDIEKYYSENIEDTNKTMSKWGGLVDGIDKFDNRFFNISPREAKNMDPQQRLLIEEMWHCIEDAGVPLVELQQKKTSAYIGVMASDYHQQASSTADVIVDSYAGLGNYDCILANRISYLFDLKGVSVAVDAACASSLVAIHEARYSLILEESDYAIAGGVNLTCHPWKYISFSKSRMLSPDGRCKTFDKEANGYVPGEGIAVILLQRLEDALKTGSHIYGIIKGSAVNHGGKTKSITAPRVESQQDVILSAYKDAAINPNTVTYIEAHGTGTSLGDPIEVEALTKAFYEYFPLQLDAESYEHEIVAKLTDANEKALFRNLFRKDNRNHSYRFSEKSPLEIKEHIREILKTLGYLNTNEKQFCSIGSVKTNIGHLEAAAGIAGIIKILMMLMARKIPRSLNITTLNPIIDFKNTPFKVVQELMEWEPRYNGLPLRASISSFGFGGVNSHAVVEEYRDERSRKRSVTEKEYLFTLSAKSQKSLDALLQKWIQYIDTPAFHEHTLYDICTTLLLGRTSMPFRYGAIIRNKAELIDKLLEKKIISTTGTDKHFCLRIGDMDWSRMSDIKAFMLKTTSFSLHLSSLRKYFESAEADVIFDEIFRNSSRKISEQLLSFLLGYAFLCTLQDFGFEPDMVAAEGSGVLLAIVFCGFISIDDAIRMLCGKKEWKDIDGHRPHIPYYDSVYKKTAMPFHFNVRYLRTLVDEMMRSVTILGEILVERREELTDPDKPMRTLLGAILIRNGVIDDEKLKKALQIKGGSADKLGDILVKQGFCTREKLDDSLREQEIIRHLIDGVLEQYVNKAKLLNTSQFTFRKFLEEWDANLKKYDTSVIKLLENAKGIRRDGGFMHKEKLLLMIIIVSSLRRLNQKWDLSEHKLMEEERFYEMIELVVDGVIPRESVIELLLTPEPDYNEIAHILNRRQRIILKQGNKSYSLIRTFYSNLEEIKNKAEWFEQAVSNRDALEIDEIAYYKREAIQFVQLGKFHKSLSREESVQLSVDGEFSDFFKKDLLILWNAGVDIKWFYLYQGVKYNRIALPAYPFDKLSFWLPRHENWQEAQNHITKKESSPGSRLLPVDDSGLHYRRVFTNKDEILRDHVINQVTILPGAAMVEAGLEAALLASRHSKREVKKLTDVIIHNPAILKGHLEINVEVDRQQNHFRVMSGNLNLCEGKYRNDPVCADACVDFSDIINSDIFSQDISSLYASFAEVGYQYGAKLQVIGNLWKQGNRFIFELNNSSGSEGGVTGLSPFLLDGAFQAALAMQYFLDMDDPGNYMYLPYFIKSLVLYEALTESSYVSFYEPDIRKKGDAFSANIAIYSEGGKPLLYIQDMIFRKVDRNALFKDITGVVSDIHYYQPAWKERALVHSTTEVQRKIAILFTGESAFDAVLRETIAARYQEVFSICRGDKSRKETRNLIYVNPEMEYDFKTAISEIFLDLDGRYNGCDLYYLWSYNKEINIQTSGDLAAAQEDGMRSLFYIFKTLAGRRINGTIDSLLVTNDVHIAGSGDKGNCFVHGSFAGFSRTLMLEIPKVRIKWIDFTSDGMTDRDKAQILFEEIHSSRISDFAAYRNGKRYVHEMEPALLDDTARGSLIREGRVYVLAGGAGGIGLVISRFMADQVKCVLILVGRRQADAKLENSIAKLKAAGSTVEYLQADLTNYEQVNSVVREIKKRHRVINGIIHTGGILDDKLVVNKQWNECWQVMAPKLLGAWNLHSVTQNEPLDFFVVFSSIVAVIGNTGQADYAAANSFLDAFVHWRRAAGFNGKSMSIDWTLWMDGGMGASNRVQEAFARRTGVIYSDQGAGVFSRLLNSELTQVVVAGKAIIINPAQAAADAGREAAIQITQNQAAQEQTPEQNTRLAGKLQDKLAAIVAAIIDVKPGDLELNTDLREYGFDSVGFTELSEKINAGLATVVNPTLFFEYPTLEGITDYLRVNYKHLAGGDAAGAGAVYTETAAAVNAQPTVVPAADQTGLISDKLKVMLSRIIQVEADSLETDADIREYGMDSVGFTEYAEKINKELNAPVNPAVFFEYPTLAALAAHLAETYSLPQEQPAVAAVQAPGVITPDALQARVRYVITQLIGIVSRIIDVEKESLDVNTDIREYGMDSVGFTEFSEKVNTSLNTSINPTLFFEFPTVHAIANYLIENYNLVYQEETIASAAEKLEKLPFNLEKQPVNTTQAKTVFNILAGKKPGFAAIVAAPELQKRDIPAPASEIAIVGISGRFPGADNLKAFWDNMLAGKDAVTLIPEDRWNWEEVFGDPQGDENKTNSKWGGFLSDIRRFDARFFKISPHEAECMDPQQRLLIEEAWHVLEDAGCRPASLADTKTGVFIGVCNDDYNELLVRNNVRMDAFTSTGSYFSIIANRISYLLNIHGPSLAIDTACSSALVAIQQAVQSIRSGDCEMALAGGINICCTPRRFISFSHAGMLSPDGRCKTFDKQANGYVRGEGVGMIFLKPLPKAVADGNHIYGLIKATSVNHGGFSTSLTAPNPNAQAELIIDAYERAGINPSTINYIETGGTGTSLGDPIEINGLKKAFKALYSRWGIDGAEKGSCGISSVKTYIGHLESASGIAGIIKLLLSMKYGMHLKLLHFHEKNPYIDLNGTPFYFVTENKEWQRLKDENGVPLPRRAGVSSFGFGGVNAHAVIEEYLPPPELQARAEIDGKYPAVIVLSAKSDERLKVYARQLVQFLEAEPKYNLHDIAYTLQNGRTAMEERLGVLAGDMETLKKALTEFYQGKLKIHNLFRGSRGDAGSNLNLLVQGRAGEQFLKAIIEDRELDKIAQLWSTGVDLDWKLIYPAAQPVLVPLPGYPFGGEKHWIEKNDTGIVLAGRGRGGKRLHRLVESNASTLREQKFITQFYGNEFFLEDHIVAGQKVLPGVAYIEMVRAAGELAGEQQVKEIKNLVWMSPVVVNGLPREVTIHFYPEKDKVSFEVNSRSPDNDRLVHCQGKVLYEGRRSGEHINLERILHRCVQVKESSECYQLFARTGLAYGPSFQGIRELHYNDQEGLALLRLPAVVKKTSNEFMLHPSLMDSALQTILGVSGEWVISTGAAYLPFSMESMEIFGKLPESCYAYVKADDAVGNKGVLKFDVKITDETGIVLVGIHNFTLRAWKQPGPDDGIVGKFKGARHKLTDAEVLELLRKLQAGELDTEQADKRIGGNYVI